MKQKHVFLVSIMHDEDENSISTEVIQGLVKREFEADYVVDNNGRDFWASKKIFEKFEVMIDSYLPQRCEKPIVHYFMGFIWEDGADENHVRHMAEECQRLCKLPVLNRLTELRDEIQQSIWKLMDDSKTDVVI
jgi:hypothetical protein